MVKIYKLAITGLLVSCSISHAMIVDFNKKWTTNGALAALTGNSWLFNFKDPKKRPPKSLRKKTLEDTVILEAGHRLQIATPYFDGHDGLIDKYRHLLHHSKDHKTSIEETSKGIFLLEYKRTLLESKNESKKAPN